jgi:16S rRNA A1518/A1519 N6-dimethyltransferase RsmA/KsgA/DIM1 with predicted DNA glycosylase/AP lyase activity
LKVPKTDIMPVLEQAGIDPQRRAETLTIDEWGVLYKVFKNKA